jgi:hypothetical protein
MVVAEVVQKIMTAKTDLAEPELQAMPLSTNHPLYFYSA